MREFVDTKPFGATCTGLAAAGTCCAAGFADGLLIALPFAVMSLYYLFFSAAPAVEWGPTRRRGPGPARAARGRRKPLRLYGGAVLMPAGQARAARPSSAAR